LIRFLPPGFFRRLRFFAHHHSSWLPVAVYTFELREFLLSYHLALNTLLHVIGALLFILGAGLQTWTLVLLTLPGIMGILEITRPCQAGS
jgi:hypothetical protein